MGRWQAQGTFGGKQKHLGHFGDEEAAARAVGAAGRCNFGPEALSPADDASYYRDVSWCTIEGCWQVHGQFGGEEKQYLGHFDDEEEAGRAYDAAARAAGDTGCCNFGSAEADEGAGQSRGDGAAAGAAPSVQKKRKAARKPRPADTAQGKTSCHRGVGWNKAAGKWRAAIRQDGNLRHLGSFEDEDAAAEAYAAACRELGRDPAGPPPASRFRGVAVEASRNRGVSWDKAMGKWVARIRQDGERRNLGRFADEDAAAGAYAAACRELGRDPAGSAPALRVSRFRGVTWHKASGRWEVKGTFGGEKQQYLGTFDDEETAARAYDAAARAAGCAGRCNFGSEEAEAAEGKGGQI
eukprot:SAG22_NODE_309_length_12657_cov_34.643733_6_plen_353_part_00